MAKKARKYVQSARQEQMEQTRARIVDAVVALHEEVGPSKTTIAGIAERAGVQRLTVYRHFPDEAALFAACSHRFSELNPPPDPSAWSGEPDALKRVEAALTAFYEHFRRTSKMLTLIYRDAHDYPVLLEIMNGFDAYLRQVADGLAEPLVVTSGDERIQATLRHLLRFSTWQSLCADCPSTRQKVDLALSWIACPGA